MRNRVSGHVGRLTAPAGAAFLLAVVVGCDAGPRLVDVMNQAGAVDRATRLGPATPLNWEVENQGQVAESEGATFTIRYTNTAPVPVTLSSIQTSCSCTAATGIALPLSIPAGAEGDMAVSVDLHGQSIGPHRFQVKWEYLEDSFAPQVVPLVLVYHPPLLPVPTKLQLSGAVPTTLKVIDHSKSPLSWDHATMEPSGFVHLQYIGCDRLPGRGWIHELRVAEVKSDSAAAQTGEVQLYFASPDGATGEGARHCRIAIETTKREEIRLSPSVVKPRATGRDGRLVAEVAAVDAESGVSLPVLRAEGHGVTLASTQQRDQIELEWTRDDLTDAPESFHITLVVLREGVEANVRLEVVAPRLR